MAAPHYPIPATPRVISPSPTPSETNKTDSYFGSVSANGHISSPETISEDAETDSTSDPELQRARSRSRSPQVPRKVPPRMNGETLTSAKASVPDHAATKPTRRKPDVVVEKKSTESNGHLSPQSAGFGSAYWRQLSRSPSPFGLIPIHREWRTFVHKHEIPRKALHVSIGFMTIYFYLNGYQTTNIAPVLMSLLVPIFAVEVVRMQYPPLNRIYIRLLGALMRESEAHDKYNGVISYLAGAWFVMYFCRKDVATMSVVLLSWCDTAASTFGRLWGRYTPRIRKGKSLAGSLAAFVFGVASAAMFWGRIADMVPASWNTGVNSFAFDGHLTLASTVREQLGWTTAQSTVSGPIALAIVSLWSGLVVSASEAIDLFGLDDNLTIPILCGIGVGGFLKAFE